MPPLPDIGAGNNSNRFNDAEDRIAQAAPLAAKDGMRVNRSPNSDYREDRPANQQSRQQYQVAQ